MELTQTLYRSLQHLSLVWCPKPQCWQQHMHLRQDSRNLLQQQDAAVMGMLLTPSPKGPYTERSTPKAPLFPLLSKTHGLSSYFRARPVHSTQNKGKAFPKANTSEVVWDEARGQEQDIQAPAAKCRLCHHSQPPQNHSGYPHCQCCRLLTQPHKMATKVTRNCQTCQHTRTKPETNSKALLEHLLPGPGAEA